MVEETHDLACCSEAQTTLFYDFSTSLTEQEAFSSEVRAVLLGIPTAQTY